VGFLTNVGKEKMKDAKPFEEMKDADLFFLLVNRSRLFNQITLLSVKSRGIK
jgi:hypothetical protein